MIIAAVVVVGWFLIDRFQGGMLGAMVGTTTDPRTALGNRSHGFGMKPRLFTLRDATYRPFVDKFLGKRKPKQYGKRVSLAIPEAYLNVTYSEPDGWSHRTIGIAIQLSSQNFKPYRTERAIIRKAVVEHLNITLISRDEQKLRTIRDRDRRKKLSEIRFKAWPWEQDVARRNHRRIHIPDSYARRRYDDELLRRGFTNINAGIGVTPHLTRQERERDLVRSVFRNREKYETVEGCTKSPGPWPNSVRYAPSRQLLETLKGRGLRGSACLRYGIPKNGYAFVQKDENGDIEFTTRCRTNKGSRFGSCHSFFFWKDIWPMGLVVSAPFQDRIPELIDHVRALFDEFEAEAHALERAAQ